MWRVRSRAVPIWRKVPYPPSHSTDLETMPAPMRRPTRTASGCHCHDAGAPAGDDLQLIQAYEPTCDIKPLSASADIALDRKGLRRSPPFPQIEPGPRCPRPNSLGRRQKGRLSMWMETSGREEGLVTGGGTGGRPPPGVRGFRGPSEGRGQPAAVNLKEEEPESLPQTGSRNRAGPEATRSENELEIRRRSRADFLAEVDTLCDARWALFGVRADPVALTHFKDGYREGVIAGLLRTRAKQNEPEPEPHTGTRTRADPEATRTENEVETGWR